VNGRGPPTHERAPEGWTGVDPSWSLSMTKSRRPNRPERVQRPARTTAVRRSVPPAASSEVGVDDVFFRHIVTGMRNGVLALTADGKLALINDEAYRIFGITPDAADIGRPICEVLRPQPEVVRLLSGVFDLHLLPNRVEMRLRPSGKVIGYTLALVRNDADRVIGASMFFKDLTRVE